MKRVNYFYIDESGAINNNQNVFIHGCIKTSTPEVISDALIQLKDELLSNIYYKDFWTRILTEGFHATENHPDIMADLYKLLPTMNYRSYFTVLNKNSEFFNEMTQTKDESEMFQESLRLLLRDRISSTRKDKNVFFFETIQLQKNSLQKVIENIFNEVHEDYEYETHIVGKEVENLAVTDYLNYILFGLLNDKETPWVRTKQNLDIISPKIGTIHFLHNNLYLSRKKLGKEITVSNITEGFGRGVG